MNRFTRRDFGKLTVAAIVLPAAAAINSRFGGVQIGVQPYSFRDRPLDPMISAMVEWASANASYGKATLSLEVNLPIAAPSYANGGRRSCSIISRKSTRNSIKQGFS
jgi:hypothetical protein